MTEAEAQGWKALAAERLEIINHLACLAWGEVYGREHETEWEYPVQAIRHLMQAYREALTPKARNGGTGVDLSIEG